MQEDPRDKDSAAPNAPLREDGDADVPAGESEASPDGLPEEQRVLARKRFSRLGAALLVMLAVSTAGQLAAGAVLGVFRPDWTSVSWLMWTVPFIPMYVVALPIAARIMRKAPAFAPGKGGMSPGAFLACVCVCFFMAYAGNAVGTAVNALIDSLRANMSEDAVIALISDDNSAAKILVTVIIGPLAEEFVFRRLLIDRMRIYGEKLAVFTSAALFGLYHGNLTQLFYAFALGLVFGYVYLKTGRLRYSAALHMIVNFFGAVVAPELLRHADLSAVQDSLSPGAEAVASVLTPGNMAYAAYVIIYLCLAAAGLIVLCKKRRSIQFDRAAMQLPRGSAFRTAWLNAGMVLAVLGCAALMLMNTLM